ncbi:gene transfer agent family protein [Rhodopseudomonas telluris]|uniref:Gene transfer agent family protein n=1 Tax=Rhodopseudomonas telluris TaxID=644215 RepID=A0ABV6EZL4_9BRAD
MSANGTRQLVWAGGEDTFCLAKVGLIFDLEDKCKAGIGVIAARLESGAYYFNDIRETIRLGLIGGGKTPEQAMAAVKNHVDGNPLAHCQLVAYYVVQAVLIGVPDDPVGRKDDDPGKEPPAEAQQTGSSTTTDASDAPKS